LKIYCPNCSKTDLSPRGSKNRPGRYQCKSCGLYFTTRRTIPKVLVFDIETLPLWVRAWDLGKQYIGPDNIIKDYCILSYAAKWLFDSDTMAEILTPDEAISRDDSRIVGSMWKLLEEADAVVTQNGKQFDTRKLNTRFVYYGYPPPASYQHIDTYQAASNVLALSSASLDYATKYYRVGKKIKTDYQLWIDCDNGNPDALNKMLEYNKNDIWILEDYYAFIRAWIPGHPNFSAYDLDAETPICPVCMETVHPMNKPHRTPVGNEYATFRCLNCGAQGRLNKKNPEPKPRIRNVR
jgi:DNA polymerase elongation subunit (family B)